MKFLLPFTRHYLIRFLALSGLLLFSADSPAQDLTVTTPGLAIPFLGFQPVIDGLPDEGLPEDGWTEFAEIQKSSDSNEPVKAEYQIRYDYRHLYIMIRVNSDSIRHRDRAYQNGDGFHLTLAKPDSTELAEEFYVLRFSPDDPKKGKPALKSRWYYNVDLSTKSLGPDTRFACRSAAGRSYFELALSWDDVYPYHPLMADRMGFNLCFVKAIGEKEKNYYFLLPDGKMQSEQSPRKYLTVNFEQSNPPAGPCSLVRPLRNNFQKGQESMVRFVSVLPAHAALSYSISLASADNFIYTSLRSDTTLGSGLHQFDLELPSGKINPGGYKLVWRCSDGSGGEVPVTILPRIDFENEGKLLESLSGKIPEGDLNTLRFQLENLKAEIEKLKDYETAGGIRERLTEYRAAIDQALSGNNPFINKTGMFRRAFLSGVDSTLQPYTIRVPEDFDRSGRYPLFVMLHGSGADDREILNFNPGNGRFIELAPFGRGTSNCFTKDYAEIDVKEAIEDVLRNYPIDTTRIVIAGFSMGGYGAYRIFYEYRDMFRGVIAFSGHPNLAGKWLGPGYPDFLDEKYLACFNKVPVFIYHSRDDLNCPYDLTVRLAEKLLKAGAELEFVTTTASGHGVIDSSHREEYNQWLEEHILQ